MGLNKDSMAMNAVDTGLVIRKRHETDKIIALGGSPNVGKSTVFNELCGSHQHTGNWAGKTVTSAQGYFEYHQNGYVCVDLPGCYSLMAHSAEEEVARDFICSDKADAVIIVCDATCLERCMSLVLQTLEITSKVVVCVNLMDEAAKKKIEINLGLLSKRLGVPVIGTAARSRDGLDRLMEAVHKIILSPENPTIRIPYSEFDDIASAVVSTSEDICDGAVTYEDKNYWKKESKIDQILTGKWTAFPIMFLALMGIFWLTITGANYPSQWLSTFLFWIEDQLTDFFHWMKVPGILTGMLIHGVYRVLAWVVSVMLPPMAIFFPLFTLLEDVGVLPRIAFNMDKCFKKCSACGKQALTMCMGFGCNAAGVVGCRIIDSPRERLIAILTNNFVPCNGRFPTLITIISMFFIGTAAGAGKTILSAGIMTLFIVLSIAITFLTSKLLSKTVLKGIPSSFTLELPPYRKPQIGRVVVRSIFDRTLFVLGRAVSVAAPAGLIIWLMANIVIGDKTVLLHCSDFLDPFGRLLGMDGVILLAFILGFPANEIVIPIMIMTYMAEGSILDIGNLTVLRQLFIDNGWTWITAISVMLFSMMHWPCSTTCLTIKKETQSVKWTLLSVLIPTATGMLICSLFAAVAKAIV
ncbi:ferrous iron transporter B [Blautia liquoris]|nr:ferrous iron transporter B [Blautia liquoris]